MGLFDKFKAGLQKSHNKLVHEIKRIVTLSPKLTGSTLEELEAALLGADLGTGMTQQILAEVKKAYETQGRSGLPSSRSPSARWRKASPPTRPPFVISRVTSRWFPSSAST